MTCVKIQKELLKLTINGQKPNLKMSKVYELKGDTFSPQHRGGCATGTPILL